MDKFLKKIMETISDIIPNEFSKMNSLTKFLPAPFNFLASIPAAADRFSESYTNDSSFMDSALYGAKALMGDSGDPNLKSQKKQGSGTDWMSMIGKIIGMFGGGGMGGQRGPGISMGGGGLFG